MRLAEYFCIICILILFTVKTNTNSARESPSQHKYDLSVAKINNCMYIAPEFCVWCDLKYSYVKVITVKIYPSYLEC